MRKGPGIFHPPWSQLTCSLPRPTWSPKGGQHSSLSLGVSLVTLGMTCRPTVRTQYLHGSIPVFPAASSPCWQRPDTSPLTGRLPFQGLGNCVQSPPFYSVPCHHSQKHHLFHSPGLIPSMSFLSGEQKSGRIDRPSCKPCFPSTHKPL